jgi:cytochrome c peroxidase
MTRALVLVLAMLMQAPTPLNLPLGLDLYLPVPDDNRPTPAAIELGRQLFFDRRLSRDESVSCASCHQPDRVFSDGRPVAVGVFGRHGRRNAPAIVNRGYGRSFFWDGRVPTLEEQVLKPIEDANEMDLSVAEASERVGVEADELARALASYVRSILSGNSPFDRYVAGDVSALSSVEVQGLSIFRGTGHCVSCHIGPNFTDEKLHNTGVAWNGERLLDAGAGRGDFKTPTLREIGKTAPYMHDGSLSTLEDVVDFYDRGGRKNPDLDRSIRPLQLTADEKRALVAFLLTLSGEITSGASGISRESQPNQNRSLTKS